MNTPLSTKHIAFLGNHPPRRCGIATFTSALCEAISLEFPETDCLVASVNDRPEGYDYPSRVHFEIDEQDPDSYRRAAEFININNVEIVSIQHEFGIYGGSASCYLLEFLRAIPIPVVMTLHTVLKEPNDEQLSIIKEFDRYCQRFVVMAEQGKTFLETIYHIAPEKIDLIPHGVIDLAFIDSNFYKDLFHVEGKTVLLTFGLLSPNKGIEYVIKALPSILKEHPNVVYIIMGETHPQQIAKHGEAYREELEKLARDCGVTEQVIFHNRFVTTEELTEFIGASDIYITPYCNEAQITSGTLAYAFGAGKAIISTPYWHAQELLAQERGILVPFANAEAIAEGVNSFLSNPNLMTAMRKRAWKAGREMTWPVVARHYMESFEKARFILTDSSVTTKNKAKDDGREYPIPPLKLDHLYMMSDQTGIFQHAIYNIPNFQEAYCVDDNARAFILTLLLQETGVTTPELHRLMSTYLSFLWYAFDPKSCRFRNFMNYERQWMESYGSEDSHARALWAMGTALRRSQNKGHRSLCGLLFQRGLPPVAHCSSPRTWAFSLIAIHEYLHSFHGDRIARQMRQLLTDKLVTLYHANASPEWKWFEQNVTYDNAKLSHALLLSGSSLNNPETLEIGLTSLRWLLEAQMTENGNFSPVGCHGFWTHGEKRARFDQQPLEAYAMVSACLEAYRITKEVFWKQSAKCCFEWFLGRNDLGISLYDPNTGGCCDGLLQDRLNVNQGAESSLSFYLAHTEMTRQEAVLSS